jgi:Protein of unknown function (DUF1517)
MRYYHSWYHQQTNRSVHGRNGCVDIVNSKSRSQRYVLSMHHSQQQSRSYHSKVMIFVTYIITTLILYGCCNCYAYLPTTVPIWIQHRTTCITHTSTNTGRKNVNILLSWPYHIHRTLSETHITRKLPRITSIGQQCRRNFLNEPGIRNHFTIRQYFGTIRQRFNDLLLLKNYFLQHIRHSIVTLSFILLVSLSLYTFLPSVADAAVSGGRMGGGSFRQSTSSSSSRSGSGGGRSTTVLRPSPSTGIQHHSSRIYSSPNPPYSTFRAPIILNSFSYNRGWYAPTHESALIMSRISTKDIVLVTGTGILLAYGYHKNRERNSPNGFKIDDGLLGSGYTVGSITVSLDVPDRLSSTVNSSNNLLNSLSQLALSADTMTKRGLQDLLSSVTLELLRQEQCITSAYTRSKVYNIRGQAEREFQLLSVNSQSKVDRLTGMI